jgi:hypothetical protein
MYSRDNTEVRANRISGYVFNQGGGLGAGSYFEDRVRPGEWIHLVSLQGAPAFGPEVNASPCGAGQGQRDRRQGDSSSP